MPSLYPPKIDEGPALIAVPQKIFCIVGKEAWLQYASVQMRDHRKTGFLGDGISSAPANSGNHEDGWRHIAASAGSYVVPLKAQANNTVTASSSCTFSAVAAASGAGTARFLMLGDSMTANGSMQSRLNALAAADGVTSIVNMGTVGSDPVKNEGYSGQPLGIFFTSGNPFFNAGTFDFNFYMTNLAVAAPTHVLIAGGFWNATYATSDGAAASAADFWAGLCEQMITSIHAYNSAIDIGFWTQPVPPYDGQDGDPTQTAVVSVERRRRNLITFGQKSIAQFSGREANKIYCIPCGQVMNPQTGYARGDLVPADASMAAKVATSAYATYAALVADLAPGDGTIAKVTNGGGFKYYVKEWASGIGHWRPAVESDGFTRRVGDSIHPSTGYNAMGDLVFAWIKATL